MSQRGCGYTVTRARNVVVCSFRLTEIELNTNDRSVTDCSLASIATHIPFLWWVGVRGTTNSANQLITDVQRRIDPSPSQNEALNSEIKTEENIITYFQNDKKEVFFEILV